MGRPNGLSLLSVCIMRGISGGFSFMTEQLVPLKQKEKEREGRTDSLFLGVRGVDTR